MNFVYFLFLFLTTLFLLIGLFYPILTKKKLLESFKNNRDNLCQACCISNRDKNRCKEICIWGTVCNCC
jgi:hypothetical protein